MVFTRTFEVFLLILGFFLFETSYARFEPFIVGGDYTSIEVYPHAAYIEVTISSETIGPLAAKCGGSILNEYILLTAAHCVTYGDLFKIDKITAIVGESNINNVPKSKVHIVSAFIKHNNHGHQPSLTRDDIALLQLERPLKFDKRVRRVVIMKHPPYNEPASVAGWGEVNYDRQNTDKLKHLRGLKVWSSEECIDRYGLNQLPGRSVTKDTFCAGYSDYENEQEHVFAGDSGGALLVRDYIQIGIVLGGTKLNLSKEQKEERIQVYTDVGFHHDWILKSVIELYCENSSSVVRIAKK